MNQTLKSSNEKPAKYFALGVLLIFCTAVQANPPPGPEELELNKKVQEQYNRMISDGVRFKKHMDKLILNPEKLPNLPNGMKEKMVQKKPEPVGPPVRWVCVSRLKGGVKGKPVTSETKGDIGTDCAEVQRRSLIDLGKAKATTIAGNTAMNVVSSPIPPEDADVFCKKEEFSTACE